MPLDYADAEAQGVCPECHGHGDISEHIDLTWDSCPYCDGHNDGGTNTCDPDCDGCEGGEAGAFWDDVPCEECNGTGTWAQFDKKQRVRAAFGILRPKYPTLTMHDVRTGNFSIRDYWFR
jgi:RecJ-like exonuclease